MEVYNTNDKFMRFLYADYIMSDTDQQAIVQGADNTEQVLFKEKLSTNKAYSRILFFLLPFHKSEVTITNKKIVLADFQIPINNIEKVEEKGFFAPILISFLRPDGFNFVFGRGLRIKFKQPNIVNKTTLSSLESKMFPSASGYIVIFTNPKKLIQIFQNLRPDLKINASSFPTSIFVFLGIVAMLLTLFYNLYSRFLVIPDLF